MPYQYGMQTSPAGGNGLGGLPKKQTTPERSTYTRLVLTSTIPQVVVPPANAKYMRVAVIGSGALCGALSTLSTGGGGGGCAASKIVRASPIQQSYLSQGAGNGGTWIATFPGYRLVGQGGIAGGLGAGQGGQGSGGDYNFNGGNGINLNSTIYLGGGGAGPNGPGGNGNSPGIFDGSGWGCGGGGGGLGRIATANDGAATGGGGAGAIAGTAIVTSTAALFTVIQPDDKVNYPFGESSSTAIANGNAGTGRVTNGGDGGGGGSGAEVNNVFDQGGGGEGLLVIEWFYD